MPKSSMKKNKPAMNDLVFVGEPELAEAPRFFEFKKRHFTEPISGMANLDYDPFPEAQADDTVRHEIIARELIFHARLRGPAQALDLNTAVEYDGNCFALTEISEQSQPGGEERTFEVTGVARIAGDEPLAVLSRLRSTLAACRRN